jgi:hypothetical protein
MCAGGSGPVTLDVLQVWKGELTQQITMLIGWFGGTGASTTDWLFELGQTYLIFGLGDSIETMRAEKCTLTALLEDADKTLELLKAEGYTISASTLVRPNSST